MSAGTAVAVHISIANLNGCTKFDRKIDLDLLENDKITFSVDYSFTVHTGMIDDCAATAFHTGRTGDCIRTDRNRQTDGCGLGTNSRAGRRITSYRIVHKMLTF